MFRELACDIIDIVVGIGDGPILPTLLPTLGPSRRAAVAGSGGATVAAKKLPGRLFHRRGGPWSRGGSLWARRTRDYRVYHWSKYSASRAIPDRYR
jgi:hypothetical protein